MALYQVHQNPYAETVLICYFIRLYYMAANTPPGPLYATIMEEKRKAMLSHVIGIHVHPENVHYKKCGHGEVKTLRMDPGMLAIYMYVVG